jgi:threonine/homoserine/homoserine lactone efflux protein
MNLEFVFLWLVTLLPIVISPGPANILYAASGSTFGVVGTIPFWLATNITSVFQTLAVGFGMNFLLYTYPNIANTIKYMGILFLLYLAFKFFKMSNSLKETVAPLTFKDGVIVEILNVKYLLIPTIMFSQFYTPQDEDYLQIYMLTFALLALTLTTSMIWILGGKSLAVFVSKKNTQKVQGLLFGTLLCITALWLVIS